MLGTSVRSTSKRRPAASSPSVTVSSSSDGDDGPTTCMRTTIAKYFRSRLTTAPRCFGPCTNKQWTLAP
jgi:hypothetical protein